MTSEGLPSRVVDREHRRWMLTFERLGGPLVCKDASNVRASRQLAPPAPPAPIPPRPTRRPRLDT